jgi:ferredoxin
MSDQPKDPANPHGPVVVRKWKMHVDKDLCIGAATCVAIAPQTFLLDSDAKAIIIEDDAGNAVYPK